MNKHIQYTVSWTQSPAQWNIPNTIKMLEAARQKALVLEKNLEQQKLEKSSLEQTQLVLQKFRLQK